jgi:hypothetical protein
VLIDETREIINRSSIMSPFIYCSQVSCNDWIMDGWNFSFRVLLAVPRLPQLKTDMSLG